MANKIYLAHNGFLRIDNGAIAKDYNHTTTTPISVEVVGSQIWMYYNGQRILKAEYNSIFQSDGVTPGGANAALTQTYIENLITVLES